VLRRVSPKTGLSFSQVTYGSMRFDAADHQNSVKAGAVFLQSILDSGITTFHSSAEYATFDFFSMCMQELYYTVPKDSIEHIVKIASPHFKDDGYSDDLLEQRVDAFLQVTGAECIDAMQWLVRHEPNTDEHRLKILSDCEHAFEEKMDALCKKGKVKSWYSFPYSQAFANKVIDLKSCAGIVDYLNFLEPQDLDYLKSMQDRSESLIALRPLFAKKIFAMPQEKMAMLCAMLGADDIFTAAVQFPLLSSVVTSEVISIRTQDQLNSLHKAASEINSHDETFEAVASLLLGNA